MRFVRSTIRAQALELYGALLGEVNGRLAPLLRVIREAAPGDPEIAAALAQLNADRLAGMREFAGHLAESRRPARRRLAQRGARRSLGAELPEVYELLVAGRGWSGRRYGRLGRSAAGGRAARVSGPPCASPRVDCARGANRRVR